MHLLLSSWGVEHSLSREAFLTQISSSFLQEDWVFICAQLFIRSFQSGVGSEPLFQSLIQGQMSSDPLLNPSIFWAVIQNFLWMIYQIPTHLWHRVFEHSEQELPMAHASQSWIRDGI